MNTLAPTSVLDAQTQRLFQLVEDYREQRCSTLLDRANQQARELLQQARRDALQRVREAVAAERARGRERIETAEARVQTRHRQREQQQTLMTLERAWPRLEAALESKWADATARHGWVSNAVHQALQTLPSRTWTLSHPPGWDSGELDEFTAAIRAHCGAAPDVCADESVKAGLRLCCGGACVDATSAGLLADRGRITARLLAMLSTTGADR